MKSSRYSSWKASWLSCLPATVLVISFPLAAFGQAFTTVQLPTIQNFSISTTVVVPDRGSVYAGGMNRSFRQSSRRGSPLLPTTNRSFSGGSSANGVWVSARVHDLDEIDQAVMREWDRIKTTRKSTVSRGHGQRASRGNSHAIRPPDHRQPRVSVVRRAVRQAEVTERQRAQHDYQLGLRLESKGEFAAASTVYRNALKRADATLKAKVSQRLQSLAATVQVAGRSPTPSKRH